MKKTKTLLKLLIKLADGKSIPASSLNTEIAQQMLQDRILVVVPHGSYQSLRATDVNTFRHYLASQYDIRDLEAQLSLMENEQIDRASQVRVSGDSKMIRHRTFQGFLVNSYQSMLATLNGKPITIQPPEGSYMFISDYEHFLIPSDVIVVGIENSENFRYIQRQQSFFEQNISSEGRLLFVNRYPQEQHQDLISWLKSIPNCYIHFGDLDLAGIAIYQNEYFKHLRDKCSFLIPHDYEERISLGSRERYDTQLPQYGNMIIKDDRISDLLSCIHRYHRGYDQEGFII